MSEEKEWQVKCAFLESRLNANDKEVERLREALKQIAGIPDKKGFTYGSTLHDVGHIARHAKQALEGQ